MSERHDNSSSGLAAVVLAAGRGTRMPGDLPKVVHEVAGRPMVAWVVDAVRAVGAAPVVLVIGHGADRVREAVEDAGDIAWAQQREQLGTGHAVRCARDALRGFEGDVVVLAGDGPLIRPATIRRLVDRHRATGAAATIAAAAVDDPAGYGRVIRDAGGAFVAIVEHASADEAQRRVRDIYPSYAVFDAGRLFETLDALRADEASGECRITDVPGLLRRAGHRVEVVDGFPPEDVLSINTREQLEQVDAILAARVAAGGVETGT